jgi:cellobiose phosphorylase
MVESLLGLHLKDNQLTLNPCLPAHWKTFTVHYRFRETVYHITVLPTENAAASMSLDGQMQEQLVIPLVDDRVEHWVEAKIL